MLSYWNIANYFFELYQCCENLKIVYRLYYSVYTHYISDEKCLFENAILHDFAENIDMI